jgi:Tol biopolymer transport system component
MSNFVHHCLLPTVQPPLPCSRARSWLVAAWASALVAPLLLSCSGQEILFAEGPTEADIQSGRGQNNPGMVPAGPPPMDPVSPPPVEAPVPPAEPAMEAPPASAPSGAPPAAPPEPPPEPPPPCTAFGAFGAPELITGLGLDAQHTLGPVFSADGLTLFFSTLGAGEGADENIFSAQRKQGGSQFAPATLVPNLDAGGSDEGTPFLSFDGLSLYFFSTRPGPGAQGDRDIWLATRPALDAPFAEPAVLPGVNGPDLEHLPRLSRDELSIVFVSSRESPNEATNLWIAQRPSRAAEFSAAVEVPGINGNSREEGFSLSPDGLTLFFASNRVDLEQMDLFVATRPDAAASFGTPEPLAQLNSAADELDPQLSPDGLELFFASSREGGFQLFRTLRECDTP